ncbi:GTPase IMAP family member 9 [Menidia menidia]
MSTSASRSELRLVVLGPAGAEGPEAACSILGLQVKTQGEDEPTECSKHTGEAAGRPVVVVWSPAWFSSTCSSEERKKHLSSLIALSSPGPHAVLLCVPVNRPADGEARALDALEQLLGAAAVRQNAAVLFTGTEELEEDEPLDEYLATWRKDLLELVGRCGQRYHAQGGGAEELLEKVERALAESGGHYISCPLYLEAEDRLGNRQREIAMERRGEDPGDGELTEEEVEAARGEAERGLWDFNVDVESIFPPAVTEPSPPGLWETLRAWVEWLSSMVRREALLGALVGLFVGGPYGGMLGATVGSVATEVRRRKTEKNK